ncbi:hypothetical protein L842_0024 [Mycobacterium intracellulare MIN_052511_1280]|nr:hypothetical protein L842_0024 [Mycobacterium intracellulare MIN_052511_1280]
MAGNISRQLAAENLRQTLAKIADPSYIKTMPQGIDNRCEQTPDGSVGGDDHVGS